MTPTTTTTASPDHIRAAPLEAGGTVNFWLRAEGLAAFLAGLAVYAANDGSWLLLLPLLLLPDLSMIGFLRDARLGAFTYNLAHNWAVGLALLGLGAWLAAPALLLAGAAVVAHVGMDRVAGYGLKYPTFFKDTHLQRI